MMLSLSFRQFSFVLLMILLSYAPGSYAEDQAPVGQMIWVKGKVTAAQPGGTARSLERRSAIFEHDVINTSSGSTGEVGFTDTSTVSLQQNSQFSVDQYSYKPGDTSNNKSVMSLVKGGLRTITGLIPKGNTESYQMKTPVATIGVRGTQYSLFYGRSTGLEIKIEVGKIDATNTGGTMTLSPCVGNGTVSCYPYAVVRSESSAPQSTSKIPPHFANEPPISSHPALGQPIMPSTVTNVNPNSPNQINGPAKTVKNFCVGLLKNLYWNTVGLLLD